MDQIKGLFTDCNFACNWPRQSLVIFNGLDNRNVKFYQQQQLTDYDLLTEPGVSFRGVGHPNAPISTALFRCSFEVVIGIGFYRDVTSSDIPGKGGTLSIFL